MKREELLRRVGNPEQLISVRESVMTDGKARGSRIITVNNGLLSFVLLPDRGFDVAEMRYKGLNLSFMSKNGIVSPSIAHTDAVDFTSSFTGGFLYTCGLDNIGGPTDGHVLHGSQTMVPATRISVDYSWNGDDYVAKISAILESTALFGRNISVKRTFTVKYMSNEISLVDELSNRGFLTSEYMMLYHFNFGYPLVDSGAKIVLDAESTFARTKEAEERMGDMLEVNPPVDEIPEFVYIHKLRGDRPTVRIVNDKLGLSASLTYNKDNLPYFCQWKSLASGDYVIGLEPSTSTLDDKAFASLSPSETVRNEILFKVEEKC